MSAAIRLRAGLDRDAVIPNADVAIGDADVAARIRIDAIRVWRVGGLMTVTLSPLRCHSDLDGSSGR